MIAAPDLRAGLSGIRCPTLVVCGEGDGITPAECSREIVQAIAGARLELLPDCGHMLTMEKPDQVNALLRDWLGSVA
jgi:pimeloyl-ACP methyl ester carboxylesterase